MKRGCYAQRAGVAAGANLQVVLVVAAQMKICINQLISLILQRRSRERRLLRRGIWGREEGPGGEETCRHDQ